MIERKQLETLQDKLSYIYGLQSGIAVENTSVGVIYLHRDPERPDADAAIKQASDYIKAKYPTVNIVVYDKK